ncbi:MAG: hypothetical protein ABI806_05895 [Candidatus Solibacter sp.]
MLSNSPIVIKGGLVLLDPASGAVLRIIPLQYNPESVSRSFAIQAVGGDHADRSEIFRLKGPAIETIKIDAVLDATDQMETGGAVVGEVGLQAHLATLELMIHPTSAQLEANNALAGAGTLEILPMERPLTVFVWGKFRVTPVRLTEFSITEQGFDPNLNPILAKVSLGMRVLNVNDVGFDNKAGRLFMTYLRTKEQLSQMSGNGALAGLGITGI